MPILNRTQLSSSDKHNLLVKTVSSQDHGSISSLSREFNISRKTVYVVKESANSALEALYTPSEEPEFITTVGVDKAHLNRAIVALAITAPNSIRAIEEQIPVMYPGCKVSYGYIQGVIVRAQQSAVEFNRSVSLSGISSIALDEMYSQGDPVLAGICLDSGYLCSLSHEARRDGDTWANVLRIAKTQDMSPTHVVKDGAAGIAKGVESVFSETEQRDDAFHALYITSKAVQKVERRAYYYIGKEEKAQVTLRRTSPADKAAYQSAMKGSVESQWKCQTAVEQYESAAKARRYLHAAFSSVCLNNGVLMTAEMAQERLMKAIQGLRDSDHPDSRAAATYLENRLHGLTLATESLHQKLLVLSEHYSQEPVELACRIFERKRGLKKAQSWQKEGWIKEMAYSYHLLQKQLSQSDSDELIKQVELLFASRHRASSAIEGFNATLRTYLYVRKGVNQGFLELFQAWYNLRQRRWGKNKGISAYESLTGKKVGDWLTLLGFPPSIQHH